MTKTSALKEKRVKIDPDVVEILKNRVAVTGNQLIITGPRLAPETYKRVNTALEHLGGKWKGGRVQAHVFANDPKELIAAALGAGSVVNQKQTYQFFETPRELADRMFELAEIKAGMSVLEPSAGRGAIARVIRERMGGDCRLVCIELDPGNVAVLDRDGFGPCHRDFLSGANAPFDRVLMNPPFTRGQDIDHLRHAYEHLEDGGGRLVAIMSESAFQNSDRRSTEFRLWLQAVSVVLVEELEACTFRDSGTNVPTRLLVIER